jgi:hypothetical protein
MDLQRCLRNAAGCERMAWLCDDPAERALWARVAMDWLKMAKADQAGPSGQYEHSTGSPAL